MTLLERIKHRFDSETDAYKYMPPRIHGLWCEFCGRKLPPVDMVVQFYDNQRRRWTGTCRECSQKRFSEHLQQQENTAGPSSDWLAASSRHFKLEDYVLNYYTDEDFKHLDLMDIKRLKHASKRWSEPARKKVAIDIAAAEGQFLKKDEQLPM